MILSQFLLRADSYHDESTRFVLLLTNLADQTYYFRLRFYTGTNRLDEYVNGDAALDGASVAFWLVDLGQNQFELDTLVPVVPNETAYLTLYPTDAAFEDFSGVYPIIGHIDISLPPRFEYYGDQTEDPQGTDPVPVLAHVYTQDFRDGTFRDFHSIPLATPSAQFEITPDTTPLAEVGKTSAELQKVRAEIRSRGREIYAALRDPKRTERIRSLLGRVRGERDLRALDALLGKEKGGRASAGRRRKHRKS